jgi:hypothetical protein
MICKTGICGKSNVVTLHSDNKKDQPECPDLFCALSTLALDQILVAISNLN